MERIRKHELDMEIIEMVFNQEAQIIMIAQRLEKRIIVIKLAKPRIVNETEYHYQTWEHDSRLKIPKGFYCATDSNFSNKREMAKRINDQLWRD